MSRFSRKATLLILLAIIAFLPESLCTKVYAQESKRNFKQRLEWKSDTKAYEYKVEIKSAKTGKITTHTTEEKFVNISMPAGNYEWRVIAYDYLGRESTRTEWKKFTIRKAIEPKVERKSPEVHFRGNKKISIPVEVEQIQENAVVELVDNNTKKVFVGTINDDMVIFSNVPEGDYTVRITNPGGLFSETKKITLLDDVRIEEERRIAEEKRLADERRLEEEQRLDEEMRLEEERRIAEEKRIEEANRLAEKRLLESEETLGIDSTGKITTFEDIPYISLLTPAENEIYSFPMEEEKLSPVMFSWTGNFLAKKYRLDLSATSNMRNVVASLETQGQLGMLKLGFEIQPGIYYWNVTPYYDFKGAVWRDETVPRKIILVGDDFNELSETEKEKYLELLREQDNRRRLEEEQCIEEKVENKEKQNDLNSHAFIMAGVYYPFTVLNNDILLDRRYNVGADLKFEMLPVKMGSAFFGFNLETMPLPIINNNAYAKEMLLFVPLAINLSVYFPVHKNIQLGVYGGGGGVMAMHSQTFDMMEDDYKRDNQTSFYVNYMYDIGAVVRFDLGKRFIIDLSLQFANWRISGYNVMNVNGCVLMGFRLGDRN